MEEKGRGLGTCQNKSGFIIITNWHNSHLFKEACPPRWKHPFLFYSLSSLSPSLPSFLPFSLYSVINQCQMQWAFGYLVVSWFKEQPLCPVPRHRASTGERPQAQPCRNIQPSPRERLVSSYCAILGWRLQTKAGRGLDYPRSPFSPVSIRIPALARTHVPKETTEYGTFEIVMVTKNLGYLGALVIVLISIYLTSELLSGESISGGRLRCLACLSLLIRHCSETLSSLSSLIRIWKILTLFSSK